MAALKWVLIVAVIGYVAFLAVLYVTQRGLQYIPETVRTTPAAAGLPQAEEVVLDTADGERVIVWHVPARADKPVFLYFHGNGGSLRGRVERFRALTDDGSGLVALSYRGYGGSSGTPTETGLLADAAAAYAFATARYPAARIAVWGESLGTGVAVALAAKHPVGHVILETPFTSIVEIAAQSYWFAPVRLLMKDQYRSDLRIGKVTAPVLILHGDRDTLVPFAMGERLYAMVNAPKQLVRFPGLGHNQLGAGAVTAAKRFLAQSAP